MKLSDLKVGQTVKLDNGFTCISSRLVTVFKDNEDCFFFICTEGKHYLDGQEDETGELVGINYV